MDKKIAIISDIHGNLSALESVLKDIAANGAREIWCLGDIVGYGPQPLECWRLIEQKCSVIIMGNHEKALAPGGGEKFNARARRAIDWTRDKLLAEAGGEELVAKLTSLPTTLEKGEILFVHGSPREPTDEYLMPRDCRNTLKMRPQFEALARYGFVGHTHLPGVMEPDQDFVRPEDMFLGKIYALDYEAGVKAIINVGSVGQPRDRDPRSCYVLFDGDSVVYRRVEYDVRATRKRILEIPALDNMLAERLVDGR